MVWTLRTVALYTPILILIAIVIALFHWTRIPHKRQPFDLLGVLLWVALLVESSSLIAMHLSLNNTMVYNANVMLDFLLIIGMVAAVLPRRTVLLPLLAGLGLAAMGTSFALRGTVDELWLEGILVIGLLVVGLCLWMLWRTADRVEGALRREPLLWIFMGLLVYHTGMLPLVGLLDVIDTEYPTLLRNLYVLVQLLAAVQYLMIARACALERERSRPAHG